MIRRAGYPAEAHVVTTDDDYLLTLHRIPSYYNSPPVLLQHGLLTTSADWVFLGRGKALGTILYIIILMRYSEITSLMSYQKNA